MWGLGFEVNFLGPYCCVAAEILRLACCQLGTECKRKWTGLCSASALGCTEGRTTHL